MSVSPLDNAHILCKRIDAWNKENKDASDYNLEYTIKGGKRSTDAAVVTIHRPFLIPANDVFVVFEAAAILHAEAYINQTGEINVEFRST